MRINKRLYRRPAKVSYTIGLIERTFLSVFKTYNREYIIICEDRMLPFKKYRELILSAIRKMAK
jgi:hypothetical protein